MRPEYMSARGGSCWLGSESTYIKHPHAPILDEELTQNGSGVHHGYWMARRWCGALLRGGWGVCAGGCNGFERGVVVGYLHIRNDRSNIVVRCLRIGHHHGAGGVENFSTGGNEGRHLALSRRSCGHRARHRIPCVSFNRKCAHHGPRQRTPWSIPRRSYLAVWKLRRRPCLQPRKSFEAMHTYDYARINDTAF
jgi:hypothetical protein